MVQHRYDESTARGVACSQHTRILRVSVPSTGPVPAGIYRDRNVRIYLYAPVYFPLPGEAAVLIEPVNAEQGRILTVSPARKTRLC